MKLLIVLLNAAVILSIVIYDNYTFHRMTETATLISKISLLLDTRGRERYEVQKHYSDWLAAEKQNDELVLIFQKKQLFEYENTKVHSNGLLSEWPNMPHLKRKIILLKTQKLEYDKIVSSKLGEIQKLIEIKQWTSSMVTLLDDMQQLDLDLSNYLSELVSQTVKSTVRINSFALTSIFLLTYMISFYSRNKYLSIYKKINKELLKRQNESIATRKTLISLMEDLRLEKNSATRVVDQLQITNDKLQRKNEEMEQFVYTVSHDLRAPLVTIGGFTSQLKCELNSSLTEKQLHRIQRIQENVNHMETLLNDLLQLSSVIRQELIKSVVSVEKVLNEQLDVLDTVIKESATKISIRKPLLEFYANERLFAQCLSNLIANAIKYRDSERPLVITISTEQNSEFVCLKIKDNGTGIESQYHRKIFKIFERLGPGFGTGVGLTIVSSVMEKHRGKVELESELGVGSLFTLLFPKIVITEASQ